MSEIAIRFTHRQTIDNNTIEHIFDVEQIPPPKSNDKPAGAIALLTLAGPTDRSVSFSADAELTATGYTKVLADGTQVPGTDPRADHVAVIDHATALMWAVESLGDPDAPDDGITQEHCIERCQQLRLLGFDDWRMPTRSELAALVDDTRHEPAIDTGLFPRVKSRWHWTSTAAAWSSASAWLVGFGSGGVGNGRRDGNGFALAVRRAGQ